MSQIIDLGKLRFYFAGDWDSTTTYELNDIVKYGGNIYVYTYGLKTSSNPPTDTTYWALMVEGFKFQAVYDNATAYRVGDGVTHGGKVYICILDSTGNTPPNTTFWSLFADGIQWEGEYVNTTAYQKNDVVSYGGSVLYIAKTDTTGNLPSDATYWDAFISGISAEGVYNAATAYVLNDVVAYGGNLYKAKGDTTGNLPSDTTFWEEFLGGVKARGAYNNATAYALNDLVNYGGTVYRAIDNTTGNLPTDTTKWEVYVTGINPLGDYDNTTAYVPNDVVAYGGSLYKNVAASTGNLPTDNSFWSLFQGGIKPRGSWSTGVAYLPGDVIVYGGSNYRVLTAHASTAFATDFAAGHWEKYNGGVDWKGTWATAFDYKVDDVVKNGASSYIALEDHTSGNFTTDLAATKWELFAEGGSYILPATTGNTGKYLSSDGTNYVFANGETNWTSISTTHTAASTERLFTDTSGGAFTVTLPASPSIGDFVELTDGASTWDTNNLTVARNGSVIQGNAADMLCDVKDAGLTLVYSDATNGWRIK